MRFPILLSFVAASLASQTYAAEIDPFRINQGVPSSPSKWVITLEGIQDPCKFPEITAPLDLLEVVERALCNHPQTRQAWANVKAQAAQVGISQAAYLPSANLSATVSKGANNTEVTGYQGLSYRVQTTARDQTLNVGWTLYDFGLRHANLDSARQLLAAATAAQDATIQTVFTSSAQAFYDLISSQGAVEANLEAEKFAQQSFMAADAKYKAGAGALADKLQAQTTFAQATLNRVKAEGELKNAQGTLAVAMGMTANTPFTIESGRPPLPSTDFLRSIDILIEEAKRDHPSLISAKAQLHAAEANVDAAKAEGMPSIKLTANIDHNDQLGQSPANTNQPPANNFSRNKSIGIQINIPLFEGLSRSYRIQAAKAQVEAKSADLTKTENQVSLDVWKSYQSLGTETENLKSTEDFLQSATQSANVAQGRYKSGVGTIIELLNAQSALANARQQRVQAFSNWNIARLKLVGSLGKLGVWVIQSKN
ncbi:MAG: TolC family protein [Pseudomonadota bacterium]